MAKECDKRTERIIQLGSRGISTTATTVECNGTEREVEIVVMKIEATKAGMTGKRSASRARARVVVEATTRSASNAREKVQVQADE